MQNHPDKISEIREAIIKLRNSYKRKVSKSPYEYETIRNAYMIAYYPYYVAPAREILNKIIIPELHEIKNNYIDWSNIYGITSDNINEHFQAIKNRPQKFNFVYFACGPCPEVYATLKEINLNQNLCKEANFNFYDFESDWIDKLNISIRIGNSSGIIINESKFHSKCDFKSFCSNYSRCNGNPEDCLKIFNETHVMFLQNYFSHVAIEDMNNVLNKLSRPLRNSKPRTLFVMIDFNGYNIGEIFSEICSEKFLKSCGARIFSKYIHSDGAPKCAVHPKLPQPLIDHIFSRETALVPKIKTNFYYIVLQRK